ncbi:MAG: nucleoside transporter C-terminal domain-containing protein [Planctomycetota bacterium]
MERFAALLGIAVFLGGAYLLSKDKKRVPWRLVGIGVGMQLFLAVFLVRDEWVPALCYVMCAAAALAQVVGLIRRRPLARDFLANGFGVLAMWIAWICVGIHAYARWGDDPDQIWRRLLMVAAFALGAVGIPSSRGASRRAISLAGCAALPALLTGFAGAPLLPRQFGFLALQGVGDAVLWVVGFAKGGANMVFGGLPQAGGFVFAIEVGSIILVFSALMSLLYHIGFLPWLVGMFARMLHRTLGVSGAESISAAANVFVGQTEAPLVVRPYLARMTESETMALMTGGFATIAGSVLGAYISVLDNAGLQRGAADLIAASVMSAPAAFVFAKILVPETGTPETIEGAKVNKEETGRNVLDALSLGVTAGTRLAVNVIAMLLVFYAFVYLFDAAFSWIGSEIMGMEGWTFRSVFGHVFAPFAFLMGTPVEDCVNVGQLIGTKTVFNEFAAYDELGKMIQNGEIGTRAQVLSTYALCGFANFMSIGIQIGGLSPLAPNNRPLYARLALKAMFAGALACQLTACIVSVIGQFD